MRLPKLVAFQKEVGERWGRKLPAIHRNAPNSMQVCLMFSKGDIHQYDATRWMKESCRRCTVRMGKRGSKARWDKSSRRRFGITHYTFWFADPADAIWFKLVCQYEAI